MNFSQAEIVKNEEATINLHGKRFDHSQTQKITSLRLFLIPSDTPYEWMHKTNGNMAQILTDIVQSSGSLMLRC